MSIEPLIFAFVFIGVLLMVEGLYLLAFGKSVRQTSKINRRLQLLDKGADPEDVLSQLRKEREQHLGLGSIPIMSPMFENAAKANIAWSPAVITMIMIGAMALAYFALTWFSSAAAGVRIPVAIAMGYGIMFIWLRNRARKRIALFEEFTTIGGRLVAHQIQSRLHRWDRPVRTEFGIIADEATYGMDVTESLERLAARIDIQDLRFLAVAVMIQSQSGGNLAEILEGLANVVRSRFKLFRKIRAITAEARWSGWFLSVFPVLALIIVQLVRPNYYDGVIDHPLFVPATIAVVVMLVINVIFMRIMVNIKV